MSHKKYAFTDANGIVVQVISGQLDAKTQAQFLSDYRTLFGAQQIIEVDASTPVWIGGAYTGGIFAEPPQPEPAPEPLPEPLPEPQLEPEI
jgi:hypothetical protein